MSAFFRCSLAVIVALTVARASPAADDDKGKTGKTIGLDLPGVRGLSGAPGYVKIKVEVELRGVLSCTEKAVTIATDGKTEWVLEFGEDKEMRAKATKLNGKTVVVEGIGVLEYQKRAVQRAGEKKLLDPRASLDDAVKGRDSIDPISVLDLGPKVRVKSLAAASGE
jgi:hypothetical protein